VDDWGKPDDGHAGGFKLSTDGVCRGKPVESEWVFNSTASVTRDGI